MSLAGLTVTGRQIGLIVHLGLAALFLHSFFEGVLGLRRPQANFGRLAYGVGTMALIAWLTVITGTWMVYPGYRAKPLADADLINYPQRFLLAHQDLANWHNFGMEWKEHVGWLAPILTTAVAFVVFRYGEQLAQDTRMRKALLGLFVVAFVAAMVSGVLGIFINKVAPNTFLNLG